MISSLVEIMNFKAFPGSEDVSRLKHLKRLKRFKRLKGFKRLTRFKGSKDSNAQKAISEKINRLWVETF